MHPLLLFLLASPGQATPTPQPIRLSQPNATIPEEFSSIRGIRELPDGRVLVSDYMDERVVLADFTRKTITPRIARGGGPQEARLPTRMVPFTGDSTLLVDLGNSRLLLLDPQGAPIRTIPGNPIGVLGLRGVDPTGAFYFAVPSWADPNPLPNDSTRVLRWNPRTGKPDPMTVVQGDRMRSDIRAPSRVPRIPTVGYAAQDGWTVDDRGRVRIVRAGGYRIESRAPGEEPVIGPSYAYPTRAVTAADRTAYVRTFLTESPMSGRGQDGGLGHSPAPSEADIAAITPGTQFAEQHPMFSAADVLAAPGGALWVGRPREPGKPALYDLFDRSGVRVAQVEIGAGRRIMAVGKRGIYALAEAESGLQYLERYPIPVLGKP